jgi:alpha-tubulin suppressor-like RCC1 family protein/uncharacterized protein YjdB
MAHEHSLILHFGRNRRRPQAHARAHQSGSVLTQLVMLATLCACDDKPEPIEPTVQPAAIRSVSLSPSGAKLGVGQTLTLAPQIEVAGPTVATTISYTSSAPDVAAVSTTGVVSGRSPGTAAVAVSVSGNGVGFAPNTTTAAINISVEALPNALLGLTLAPASPPELVVGQSLTIVPTPQTGSSSAVVTYGYATSNSDVASVSAAGVITAVREGSATISVVASASGQGLTPNTISASISVAVRIPPDALVRGTLTLADSGSSTFVDRSFDLAATVQARSGASVSYSAVSNDSSIIRITPGAVAGTFRAQALSVGTTDVVITATGTGPLLTATALSERRSYTVDNFVGVVAGVATTCAVTQIGLNGNLFCWGENGRGQLGNAANSNSAVPVPVGGGLKFSRVSLGNTHTCGIAIQRLYCWGANDFGQLGDGTTSDRRVPTAVVIAGEFQAVAVGSGHTCALSTSNELYCWGDNRSGQLGDGTRISRLLPVRAGTMLYFHVVLGALHTCADKGIPRTGQFNVDCWGANTTGQLGDGTRVDRLTPTAVPAPIVIAYANAGAFHTCGLNLSSQAFCFGSNGSGQLGDGTRTDRSMPVAVAGSLTFSAIGSGTNHSCGISDGGAIRCWGDDLAGQLGNGAGTQSSTVPTPVHIDQLPHSFTTGGSHNCVVVSVRTNASRIQCWGANGNGQLGDGSTINRHSPTYVVP